MITTIMCGQKACKFEATLGTAELYQIYTGKSILDELEMFKGIKRDADGNLNINTLDMSQINRMIAFFRELAFVMFTQANTQAATPIDRIRAIKAKMTKDDYIVWLDGFDNTELTTDVLMQTFALWNSQFNTSSEAKN